MDLEKFEQFRRKFDPSFANKTGGGSGSNKGGHQIKWPTGSNQGNRNQPQDDDLYS